MSALLKIGVIGLGRMGQLYARILATQVSGVHLYTPVVLLTRAGVQHDVMPYLVERFGDAYRAQLQHFADCLRNGQAPSVGGADALAACEIGVAATLACQTGRPVIISELRHSSGEVKAGS
jgi:GFO/IDH/MocA oxidoreductase family protein